MTTPRHHTLKSHIPFILYLLFATVWLGLQMFQGFSFLDIGVYMSGYEHFGTDPYPSYYLGQWLMSYRLTSAICRLLSIHTYLGLRLLHLIFVVATQAIIYLYLQRHISRTHIILGLSLATLAHFGSYTEINYNDYSAGLLTLAILSYHRGISSDKSVLLITSGALVGAAFFFRIVNITFLSLPLLAWFTAQRWQSAMPARRQFAWFFAGVSVGCGATLLTLHIDGFGNILTLTLHDIADISGDKQDAHNLHTIIFSVYSLYKGEIQGISVIALLTYGMAIAAQRLRGIKQAAVMSVLSMLIIVSIYFWESPANITIGICLIGLACLLLDRKACPETATLYILSLLVPMVLPIGSNAGPDFYGKDVCFLTLPLAVTAISRLTRVIPPAYRRAYAKATAVSYVFISLAMAYTNIKRPMMEEGNRLQCRYGIDSPKAGLILTTRENAAVVNHLISNLKPMIQPGSYMICSFHVPMISLLDCKPYAVYTTVFTTDKMNGRYIDVAYRHTGKLPYLLTDTHNTSQKDSYVEQYLQRISPYTTVWTDGRFCLKAPDAGRQ